MTKSIGVIISFVILILSSCKKELVKPFEFSVDDYNYSQAYSMTYKLTEKKLTITFKGELEEEKDSLLFSTTDLLKSSLRRISSIQMESLSDIYMNNCIADGDVKLVGFKKDSILKVIQLNNYYHPELSPVFEMINEIVPDKFKMYHNKEKLLNKMNKCKSFNIVKDIKSLQK